MAGPALDESGHADRARKQPPAGLGEGQEPMGGCSSNRTLGNAFLAAAASLLFWGCPSSTSNPCEGVKCEQAGYVCVAGADQKPVCAPPADPCGASNPCKADERCVVNVQGLASCLVPDRCYGVTCGVDKRCDPSTGQCTIERKPCDGVSCPAGQVCNAATGACEDANAKCKNVCCDSTQVCDPSTGECVPDQCDDAEIACKCGPSEKCNGVTGKCDPAITACGACAADQYCDPGIGSCVKLARGTPSAGEIGGACGSTADCTRSGTEAFCLTDGGLFGEMPGGSCSASCNELACPRGAGCVDVGLAICLDICVDKSDCRQGYTCTQITSEDPRRYCFPAGTGGSKCAGPNCQPIGGACIQDDDCLAGAECSRNLPGGYCQKRGCKQSDCDTEAESCWCLTADQCSGATIGLAKCDTRLQDCRPGYACNPVTRDGIGGYCYPRNCEVDNDCRAAGTSCDYTCDQARGVCDTYCKSNADCFGGRTCDTSTGHCFQGCRTTNANCGPDALCDVQAQRCVRKCRSDATCPDNSFCDRIAGKCIARCTSDTSCSAGQFCDATGRCRVRCAGDGDCGTNEYCDAGRCNLRCTSTAGCSFGEFCETTSGQCRRDLKSVLVGNACRRDGDCGAYNAECLTGWTDGYCTAPDCSADEACGPGAACVPAEGKARCLKTCVGDADCRPSYACRERAGQNVCVPGGE